MDDRPLELRPEYKTVRNEILQPDRTLTVSRYFLENWAPQLGPVITQLVIRLRTVCQDNETAQKMFSDGREWQPVFPTQKQLAADVGISERSLRTYLQDPRAQLFIKRISRTLRDDETGEIRRLPDAYAVAMDDIPTPEDERQIALLAGERIIESAMESRSGKSRRIGDSEPRSGKSCRNRTLREERLRTNVKKTSVESSPKTEALAEQLAEELDDRASKRFFLLVAARCTEQMIFAALAETKDAHLSGRIRKNRGACFTDLIKRKAQEAGIVLKPC